jgi:hypothetical protein
MQREILKNKDDVYLERYPLTTLIISNFVSLSVYGIGAYIMFWVGILSFTIYMVYIIALEIVLYVKSCKDCYYYGKSCAFGKGKLACIITRKGNPENFANRQVSWHSVVPDLLVTVIPMIIAIALMIIDFEWILPVLLLLLLVLTSVGNSYVRGMLACKYCRQRELGCPAEKLFNRGKSGQQV